MPVEAPRQIFEGVKNFTLLKPFENSCKIFSLIRLDFSSRGCKILSMKYQLFAAALQSAAGAIQAAFKMGSPQRYPIEMVKTLHQFHAITPLLGPSGEDVAIREALESVAEILERLEYMVNEEK